MSNRNRRGRGKRAVDVRKGAAWCELHRRVHDPSLCVELEMVDDRPVFRVRSWNAKRYGWQDLTTDQVHALTSDYPKVAAHLANERHTALKQAGLADA